MTRDVITPVRTHLLHGEGQAGVQLEGVELGGNIRHVRRGVLANSEDGELVHAGKELLQARWWQLRSKCARVCMRACVHARVYVCVWWGGRV